MEEEREGKVAGGQTGKRQKVHVWGQEVRGGQENERAQFTLPAATEESEEDERNLNLAFRGRKNRLTFLFHFCFDLGTDALIPSKTKTNTKIVSFRNSPQKISDWGCSDRSHGVLERICLGKKKIGKLSFDSSRSH